ncbi:hypothetical protein AYO44_09655 [Planctomycetaceae bacterium SCGC AG-212-F19]|nr:hypothetical protein AYO44_09655 [Planctomycetaceae bacterium SCGC AG-212-F19]
MAQMCHWSALAGVVGAGLAMPLGPLLVWKMKKDIGPFVDAHGKESLNFQITYWILTIVLALLTIIDGYFLLLPLVVVIYAGVMAILAGTKAVEGQMYQYPLTIRLIR